MSFITTRFGGHSGLSHQISDKPIVGGFKTVYVHTLRWWCTMITSFWIWIGWNHQSAMWSIDTAAVWGRVMCFSHAMLPPIIGNTPQKPRLSRGRNHILRTIEGGCLNFELGVANLELPALKCRDFTDSKVKRLIPIWFPRKRWYPLLSPGWSVKVAMKWDSHHVWIARHV